MIQLTNQQPVHNDNATKEPNGKKLKIFLFAIFLIIVGCSFINT